MESKKIFNSLYWKLSGTFLLLLLLLGLVYIWISTTYTNRYFQEVHQRLNKDLAQFTVDHIKTFNEDGEVDTTAIQDIMHSMMVINPSVEVYLLDPSGKIITYVAPYKKIKLEKVSLQPVKKFLAQKENPCVMGDDPRNPGGKKAFSAAPILNGDDIMGYYYVILAGEKQGSVLSTFRSSYILAVGARTFFLTLFGALLIALVVIYLLTRNLRDIIDTVQRFKDGDYTARISSKDKGELTVLSNTFNDMADTIVSNIEELKTVDNLRRELTANVSHDLRTPLAIMQGYAETLMIKKDQLSEEERDRYTKTILSSANKMNKLVEQLFEYSKLEAQQITPNKEPFFISELVQDIFHNYQILAKKKNISFDLDIPQNLPLVFADIALVERVFQNLIDNALKFTPENGKITMALFEKGDNIEVKIADTGPGIPEHEQSYIFERYHRIKTGKIKSSNGSGSGLGLAIVKKILDIHQATIGVISKPEQGAEFFFNLPVYKENNLAMG